MSRTLKFTVVVGVALLLRLLYFNLSAQQGGRPVPERLAERIAAITAQRADKEQSLFINPLKPPQYSYRAAAELAFI